MRRCALVALRVVKLCKRPLCGYLNNRVRSCQRQFARLIIREFFRLVCRAEPLTSDKQERKALQLLDMMDAWLARRKADAEPTPLVYDPGEPGDLNPEGKSTEAEAVALFRP